MAVAEELTTAAVDELPVRTNGLILALLIRTGSRGLGALKTGVFVKKVVRVDTEDAVRGTFPEQIVEVDPPLHSLLQLLQTVTGSTVAVHTIPIVANTERTAIVAPTLVVFFFVAVIASTIVTTTTYYPTKFLSKFRNPLHMNVIATNCT